MGGAGAGPRGVVAGRAVGDVGGRGAGREGVMPGTAGAGRLGLAEHHHTRENIKIMKSQRRDKKDQAQGAPQEEDASS